MDTETRVSGKYGWVLPPLIGPRFLHRDLLIGLTGRAGSGKNTVADIICEMVPTAQQYALAGPVKTMALAIDPLIEEWEPPIPGEKVQLRLKEFVESVGWDDAKRSPEVRRFLQRLGTEGVRGTFGDNAWVDLMLQWWEVEVPDDCRVGVLTDVRFPNELERVDVSIRVERPGTELVGDNASHASEQLSDPTDYAIHNSGSLDHLRDEVRYVLRELHVIAQSSETKSAGQDTAAA